MKCAVIVVLYHYDQSHLDNIASYAPYFDQVILVDNSDYPVNIPIPEEYHYISLGKNYGIAYALNCGIDYLKNTDISYVMTMDQDSRFQNNILDVYKEKLQEFPNQDVILSPNYVVSYKREEKPSKEFEEIYWSAQSGCFFPMAIFEHVGLFRDDFFIDVVDYEFFVRARSENVKIIKCNQATLLHEPGEEREKKILSKSIKFAIHPPVRIYYQARNLLWCAIHYKNYHFFKVYIKIFLKIILLFDHRMENIKAYHKATKDALYNNLGEGDLS